MQIPNPNSEIPNPRSAYLHVPFCARRCGYCNFTLVAGRDDLIEPYLQALDVELSRLGTPRPVDTLFIGGGTPTQLKGSQLERLLHLALHWFPLLPGAEFSVEANPEDLDAECGQFLAAAGVTRISLGAQSFDADKLRTLERSHRAEDIVAAAQTARRCGATVALDLIFAAPRETLSVWRRDLDAALALSPQHLSTYGLTFEKGAAFWGRRHRGELVPVAEQVELEMYLAGIDLLMDAGYEHYEVSNFALPRHRCRHNEVYWTGGSYYAAGPGAARYVAGARETNQRSTTTYIKRLMAGESPVAEREILPPDAAARERIVFGLRRLEGIRVKEFRATTGHDVVQLLGAPLQRFLEEELLSLDQGTLRLTRQGLLVSDSIWPDFLSG